MAVMVSVMVMVVDRDDSGRLRVPECRLASGAQLPEEITKGGSGGRAIDLLRPHRRRARASSSARSDADGDATCDAGVGEPGSSTRRRRRVRVAHVAPTTPRRVGNLAGGVAALTGADVRTLRVGAAEGPVVAVEPATADDLEHVAGAHRARSSAVVEETDGTPAVAAAPAAAAAGGRRRGRRRRARSTSRRVRPPARLVAEPS